MNANVLLFTGTIAEIDPVHYSGAGTPVVRFELVVIERRRRGRRVVDVEERIPCAALERTCPLGRISWSKSCVGYKPTRSRA